MKRARNRSHIAAGLFIYITDNAGCSGLPVGSGDTKDCHLTVGRTDAVDFDVAIFTNLTYDHLDYHKTMEKLYLAERFVFTGYRFPSCTSVNSEPLT